MKEKKSKQPQKLRKRCHPCTCTLTKLNMQFKPFPARVLAVYRHHNVTIAHSLPEGVRVWTDAHDTNWRLSVVVSKLNVVKQTLRGDVFDTRTQRRGALHGDSVAHTSYEQYSQQRHNAVLVLDSSDLSDGIQKVSI